MQKLQRQNGNGTTSNICSSGSNRKETSHIQSKYEKRQIKLQGHKTSKISEQAFSRNPYLNYFRQFYAQQGGKIKDVAKEAGANWKKMSPNEKIQFIHMAKSAEYVFSSRNKRMNKIFEMFDMITNPSAADSNNIFDPKESPETRNPYINYLRDCYSGHEGNPTNLIKEASSTWNSMEPQDKNKYIDSAKLAQYKFYFRNKRLNKLFRLWRPVVTETNTPGKHCLDQVNKYLKHWQSDVYRKVIGHARRTYIS